jgi:hypothetical protein
MNICVNYWGQPRLLNIIEEIYNTQINDKNNNFYICYTTWKTEDVTKFNRIFPNSYINQIDHPDLTSDKYKYMIKNFQYDSYNPDIKHCILGLYVREQSLNTVSLYEKNLNIKFDFIITIRPDTEIKEGILFNFYSYIKSNPEYIYVPDRPRYDVYGKGAVPDALLISKLDSLKEILKFPNFDDIKINGYLIHPESSTGQMIQFSKIKCIFLDIFSFRFEHLGRKEYL